MWEGGLNVINTQLLDESIKDSGYKIGYICGFLNISPQAFWKKRKGEIPFKDKEIQGLTQLCSLSPQSVMDIFCSNKVDE